MAGCLVAESAAGVAAAPGCPMWGDLRQEGPRHQWPEEDPLLRGHTLPQEHT